MSRTSLGLAALAIVAIAGAGSVVPGPRDQAWADPAPSPYVDQLGSSVRGLSQQEVDDLINGRGLGYARMAELNGYPGPLHVLQLKHELGLTPDQIFRIESAIAQMQASAKQLGNEIVDRERQISDRFARRTITASELQTRVEELAGLYGRLRAVHLQAHLAVTPLLSAAQIVKYNQLRGYDGAEQTPGVHHGH